MKKVELPKDALGREIPLDIKVLYDEYGEEFFTDRATYMRMTGSWWFSGHFGLQSVEHRYRASRLHITRPDSVTCPSCGMSNSIAWGSLMATPQKEAVAMLADSWNSR